MFLRYLKKKKKQFSSWSQILLKNCFFFFFFIIIILVPFEHCGGLSQTSVSLGAFLYFSMLLDDLKRKKERKHLTEFSFQHLIL